MSSVPVRRVTEGPRFHWFGYYDKWQFDPTDRYLLAMEVDFEHRSPTPDDPVVVGMVDLAAENRWVPLGTSRAWCWQQGCMLQWLPGSTSEVIWNDREGDRYVARILDVAANRCRTVDFPIYAVSPNGQVAVAPDFRRIQDVRPGYGYPGIPDPFRDNPAPEGSGIWRVDLVRNRAELILSLRQIAEYPNPLHPPAGVKHYVNHLLFNPTGERFVFLHRWLDPRTGRRQTRMFTAAPDGSELRAIDSSGVISHFIWWDAETLLSWTHHPPDPPGFYRLRDSEEPDPTPVGHGIMRVDGHCSVLPGGEWVLNDTYPLGRERRQELYLFHPASGRRVDLAAFSAPREYQGEWRCDLHPRFSRSGRWVCVDSAHEGLGRQLYLLDIGEIVGG